MDTVATARLADAIADGHPVAATMPRQALESVLAADGTPELVLKFVHQGTDEPPETVAIEWTKPELETLLGRTEGELVTLTFDRDELAELFDDVEAHGLRTRAAIVAVAAVGALGSAATIANAMPTTADTNGAPAASGGDPAATLVSDAALSGGFGPAPSVDHETFGVGTRDATDGILIGGVVLALAGATFVSRRLGAARPA